jgi:hypothetical protein
MSGRSVEKYLLLIWDEMQQQALGYALFNPDVRVGSIK